MSRIRLGMFLLCGAISWTAPARAQEAEGPLAELRNKDALTDEERSTIRNWVTEQIGAVATSDAVGGAAAFERLKQARTGSNAYGEVYLETALPAISSAYQKAQPVAAARLVTLLSLFQDVRALDTLLQALRDERTAVRAAAVIGLRSLRNQIATDPGRYQRVLSALVEAGKRETSAQTLRLLYAAMDFSQVQPRPNVEQNINAFLDLLDARVEQFGSSGLVPADGAETEALEIGGRLRQGMNEAQRRRYAIALARTMQYAVQRYTGGESPLALVRERTSGPDTVALRNAMEQIIARAEEQLRALLNPEDVPRLTQTMERTPKARRAELADIINDMNRWADFLRTSLELDLRIAPPPAEDGGGP